MTRSIFTRKNLRLPVAVLAAVAGLVGCDKKPEMLCTANRGTFAVKYTLMESNPSGGPCSTLKGGRVGVQTFINPGEPSTPSYDKTPVAIKVETVGRLVAQYKQMVDPTKLYSLGRFTETRPGPDGFCDVSELTPAELKLAAVPATTDMMGNPVAALPAIDARYEWSNLRFWVNPGSPGTQFSADLTYTRDGCTAKYAVQAIYPAAACGVPMMNSAGMTTMVADDKRCSFCGDAKEERPSSHIDPTVETICEPTALLCVPARPIPSARTPEMCAPITVGKPWPDASSDATDTAPAQTDTATPAAHTGSPADTGSPAETGRDTAPETNGRDTAADTPRG